LKVRAQTGHTEMPLCSSDLDPDLMVLTEELDLDIMKAYLHTKNDISRSTLLKVNSMNR